MPGRVRSQVKSRGFGLIFRPTYRDRNTGQPRRSSAWWIQYSFRGERYRESARSPNRSDAVRLLKRRLAEIGRGRLVGPSTERTTFEELAAMVVDDYKVNGRRSLRRAEQSLTHLLEHFGLTLVADIHEGRIKAYVRARLEQGAANATVNRELAALKRAFRLGEIAQKVVREPHIALLKEAAPRKGFFEREQLDALLPHLPESVRPVIGVAYITGWRMRSEILTRKWEHVDFKGGWLRLDPGETKNAEGRSFAFTPELRSILERQRALASAIEPHAGKAVEWVFFRPDGTPVRYFRRSWLTACEKARLVGKIPHDFRRTAVRNLARIGVDRKTAMEMVGHKTESIYRRYTITDEAMLRDASARLAALHEAEREENSQSSAKVRGGSIPEPPEAPRVSSSAGTTGLVAWDGVEPPTRGFSVRCSTN
jgi:integrase